MNDFLRQLDEEQASLEAARHQALVEMEQTLVVQEQVLERDTGVPIYEQADGAPRTSSDGHNVITASHGGGASNTDAMASGATIGSPGAGTDPSETQTSSGPQTTANMLDAGPAPADNIELQGIERTFEADGRRDVDEFDNHDHALERLRPDDES